MTKKFRIIATPVNVKDRRISETVSYATASEAAFSDPLNRFKVLRMIVDQARVGMGHQTATVTAMNRLMELGYRGIFEVLVRSGDRGGKTQFLTALPQIQLDLDPNAMEQISQPETRVPIWVCERIQIKQIRDVILGLAYYWDENGSSIPIEPADLSIAAGNDDWTFDQYNSARLIVVQPTGYTRSSWNAIAIGGSYQTRMMNQRHQCILYAEPRCASDNVPLALGDVISAQNEGRCDTISIYGRYDPKNGRPVSAGMIASTLDDLSVTRPLIILHHRHETDPSAFNNGFALDDLPNELSKYLNTWAPDKKIKPLVIRLDPLPGHVFRYVTYSTSLLIAEFSNTYQHREKNGLPYIKGFGGASIDPLPDGVLSCQEKAFENIYCPQLRTLQTIESL